jgi:hypothetical protein
MRFDGDRLLGLSAMMVAVASLAVVVYQAQLQRDQNELERRAHAASVLPYLMFVTTMNNDGVFLNLRNTGIGPARIERVRVLHRGGEFSEAVLEVTYSSVFGEQWVLRSDNMVPQPVSRPAS